MVNYRLRHLELDDKVCEQVDGALMEQVYPKEVIQQCIQQSSSWNQKRRRVRHSTALSLVWLVIAMALWSRLNQALVWQKLVSKLCLLHPKHDQGTLSDSAVSGRRQQLGWELLQQVQTRCCVVMALPEKMPTAFFGRYRIMAIDGTVFNTPDTPANDLAFGRSHNQYGKGAYPQVRCVLLSECGTHGVVGLHLDRYAVSEVHGAYQLLSQLGPHCLVTMDAGITSGGMLQRVREQQGHALGVLEPGVWEKLPTRRRLMDGSVLVWVPPSGKGDACYPLTTGMWVRIISYQLTDERLGEGGKTYRLVTTLLNPRKFPARAVVELYHERWEIELVIDEIKTHERAQRKVLRSKTPEGIKQELYGVFLAHYLVRAVMMQAAVQAECAAERLSFTEGLFRVCEMSDTALLLHPDCAPLLFTYLVQQVAHAILPPRRLRINPREVKQVYNKYKPKKRERVAPPPFEPEDQFLDFVSLLDPLAPPVLEQTGTLK